MSMRKVTKLSAFILLFIGTTGLLINEFVFDWGRCATLTFAAINIVGFIILAFMTWGIEEKQ
ncbi:hypothetical protein ES703_95195 [subsurface metagenome]